MNALSTSLDVRVYKNGSIYYQEYRRGHVVDDLKVIGETDRTGTTVHFIPDPEIFTETTEYDFEKLKDVYKRQPMNDWMSISNNWLAWQMLAWKKHQSLHKWQKKFLN